MLACGAVATGCIVDGQCIDGYVRVDGTCTNDVPDGGMDGSTDGGDGGPDGMVPDGGVPETCDPGATNSAPPCDDDCLFEYDTDFQFLRESEATLWVEETQCFARFAENEPRVLSDGSVYIEGTRTNLIADSNGMDAANTNTMSPASAWWAPEDLRGQIEEDTEAFPFDEAPWRVSFPSDATGLFRQINPSTICATATSAFHSGDDWLLQACDDPEMLFNVPGTSEWTRAGVTTEPQTAPCDVGLTDAADAAREVSFFGVQAEQGVWPSQYIETDGGVGVRDRERMTSTSVPQEMQDGRWEVDVWPAFGSDDLVTLANLDGSCGQGTAVLYYFEGGSGTATIHMQASPFAQLCVAPEGEVWRCSGQLLWSAGQRLTFSFDSVAGEFTISGATIGNGTVDEGAWTLPGLSMQVGSAPNGYFISGAFFGRMSRPRALP